MTWEIVARPEGKNDNDKNEGGMVIEVQRPGGRPEEVGRVAFERSNSLHPDVDFDEQLDKEIAKAKKGIEVMEELTSGAGKLA